MTNDRPRDRYGRPLPAGSRSLLESTPAPRTAAEARARGIELFDRERFFEAHECFEWLWKCSEVDDADRPFWKAVAQLAVGFCHIQRDNPRGARAVLARAESALQSFGSRHLGVDVKQLIHDARRVTDRLRQDRPAPEAGFPPFPVENP